MTDVWDDIAGGHAAALRDRLLAMVAHADNRADRTQQTVLGPSEVGDPCTYCLAAKILGVYARDDFYDPWPAIIGTAVHTWLEGAAELDNRDNGGTWNTETRVYPDADLLPKGGKADLYDDATRTVVDHKVVGQQMLRNYKANGPGVGYRRQAHIYGLGFAAMDWPVEHVAIAFWHRGGRAGDLHVWAEPYSEAYAREALERYRTIRGLCADLGEALLPSLPSDSGCFNCSRSARSAPAA